ncbi:MAG TPA: 2-amino-4-hydroxy-6-hydroxymethyldihydropteridine diphosphokinase, partial [Gammaproteobacteria bacterium]|nr:2-amino-4-hydroxy-6-hydroxymethyldihydropteridine diphosphokinase [Gammaproteobacteria bacterium]
MTAVYLGLGSNQNNPYQQISTAIRALNKLPDSHIVKTSSIYTSKPVGPQDQPDYLNAAVLLETGLPAHELLPALQSIENRQGRERTRRWGPRTIDLDILLFGEQILKSNDLVVPHPEMHRRGFVLVPLAELTPHLQIPGHGR